MKLIVALLFAVCVVKASEIEECKKECLDMYTKGLMIVSQYKQCVESCGNDQPISLEKCKAKCLDMYTKGFMIVTQYQQCVDSCDGLLKNPKDLGNRISDWKKKKERQIREWREKRRRERERRERERREREREIERKERRERRRRHVKLSIIL